MSVIQAKGLCWEVISYFFSGILPCADPSNEGLGIMRGLRAAFPCCTEHTAHFFGGPKHFCNISCYRKDMRQTLRARYFLGFDTLQVVAFRYVCFFVCLFVLFQKSSRDLDSGWVCANVWVLYGLWEQIQLCSIWLQWPSCSAAPLPGNEVASCAMAAPMPHQSQCELSHAFKLTAD